jgi:hypothetical protein
MASLKDSLRRYRLTREIMPAVWKCLDEIGASSNPLPCVHTAPPTTGGGIRRSVLDDAVFELEELEHVSAAVSGLKFALRHVVSLLGSRPETLVPVDQAPRQRLGASKGGRAAKLRNDDVAAGEARWTRAHAPKKGTASARARHVAAKYLGMRKAGSVPDELLYVGGDHDYREHESPFRRKGEPDVELAKEQARFRRLHDGEEKRLHHIRDSASRGAISASMRKQASRKSAFVKGSDRAPAFTASTMDW